MNYTRFHERKDVWLNSLERKSCAQLWSLFNKTGLKRNYDVYSFDRPKDENIEIWQTDTIVGVNIFNDEAPVYYGDKSWTRINFYYLLPSLPRNYIPRFCRIIKSISETLALPMQYNEQVISSEELENMLEKCADEVTETIGEPGSETAAILIKMTYLRK